MAAAKFDPADTPFCVGADVSSPNSSTPDVLCRGKSLPDALNTAVAGASLCNQAYNCPAWAAFDGTNGPKLKKIDLKDGTDYPLEAVLSSSHDYYSVGAGADGEQHSLDKMGDKDTCKGTTYKFMNTKWCKSK